MMEIYLHFIGFSCNNSKIHVELIKTLLIYQSKLKRQFHVRIIRIYDLAKIYIKNKFTTHNLLIAGETL